MVTYSFIDGKKKIRGFVDLNVEYVLYEYFSEWFAKNHPGKNLSGFLVHTNRESWLSVCDFISKVSK